MQIPAHPRIRALGYVSDEVRSALLAHARALVVPSPYESLSIVLLEAWNHARAGAGQRTLHGARGPGARAPTAGCTTARRAEFDEALTYLLTHDREREALGRQGLAYVEREYRWPTVLARVEALLAAVGKQRASA